MQHRSTIQFGAIIAVALIAPVAWLATPSPRDSSASAPGTSMPPMPSTPSTQLDLPASGSMATPSLPAPASLADAMVIYDAAKAASELADLEERMHVDLVHATIGAGPDAGPVVIEGVLTTMIPARGSLADMIDVMLVMESEDVLYRDDSREFSIGHGWLGNAFGPPVATRFEIHRYFDDDAGESQVLVNPVGEHGAVRAAAAAAGWLADGGKPFDHNNARNRRSAELRKEADRLSRKCQKLKGDDCRHKRARALCTCNVGFFLDVAGAIDERDRNLQLIYDTVRRRGMGIGIAAAIEILMCVAELMMAGEPEAAAFGKCILQVALLAGLGDGINDQELIDQVKAEYAQFNQRYDDLVRDWKACREEAERRHDCGPGDADVGQKLIEINAPVPQP